MVLQGHRVHITNFDLPAGPVSGTKSVAAAGTAEALGAGALNRGVYIRALAGNSGVNVYIGGSTIDNTGFGLTTADPPVFLSVDNLNSIWLDVDTNGDGVSYVGS